MLYSPQLEATCFFKGQIKASAYAKRPGQTADQPSHLELATVPMKLYKFPWGVPVTNSHWYIQYNFLCFRCIFTVFFRFLEVFDSVLCIALYGFLIWFGLVRLFNGYGNGNFYGNPASVRDLNYIWFRNIFWIIFWNQNRKQNRKLLTFLNLKPITDNFQNRKIKGCYASINLGDHGCPCSHFL